MVGCIAVLRAILLIAVFSMFGVVGTITRQGLSTTFTTPGSPQIATGWGGMGRGRGCLSPLSRPPSHPYRVRVGGYTFPPLEGGLNARSGDNQE